MAKAQFPKKTNLLFYFLRGSKGFFLCSLLFAALSSMSDLAGPRIVGLAVDRDIPYAFGALLVAGIAVAGAAARYLFRLLNAKGAETFVKRMRDELFKHIEHLPFSWYMKNQTGDIIQRCTSDVETVKRFVAEQFTMLVRIVVLLVLALSFMWTLNARLMLVATAFLPVIIGYSAVFHGKISETFLNADEEEGRLSSIAQENLTGVRVVRAFGRERYERERFEQQNNIYTAAYNRLNLLITGFWTAGEFVSGIQVLTVLSVGATLAVRGQMSAGDYIAFVSYNAMLVWPVRTLGRVISEMSKAGVSVARIMEIMNAETEQYDVDKLRPPMEADITFDHVSFAYTPETPKILDDVSFTIPRGHTIGILGGTGSGKSTLTYLLDRLYDLEKENGTIRIGETDIRDMDLRYLRENIGMVLQEPFLFSRTLADNIAISDRKASMHDIRTAARIASLDDAVSSFTKGYETKVGERGVTLSGGQKQRAAIAQMVLRGTPVMIFDDSLSAVDAETDAKIRAQLKQNTNGATVIIVSHRITTLMHADDIIVLHKGRIAEQGTHEALKAHDGLYKKICEIQGVA